MDEKNHFAGNLNRAEFPTASYNTNQNCSGVLAFLGQQQTRNRNLGIQHCVFNLKFFSPSCHCTLKLTKR